MTGNPVNLKTTPVPFSTPPLLIDQTVNWSLTTPFGIAYGPFSVDNPFAGVWNSGHLNDVVLCPTNVPPGSQTPGLSALLVGADAAGVWNVGAAISVIPTNFDPDSPTAPTPTSSPYSHNWDAPGTVCLCRGLEPEHVYAGTGDVLNGVTTGYLYETVATNGVYSLSTWRLAPNATGAPTNFETIYRILVVKGAVNRIVMATNIGVYWSVIPAPSGNYDWQHVTKLANGKPFPLGAYSSVAAAPDGVVVAAYGDGAGHSGIFYGDWSSGELTMTLATVPAAAQDSFTTFDQNMYRISLAASARQPSVIYAIGSAIDDTIYAILVSQDGGKTWTKPYDPQNQSVAPKVTTSAGVKLLFTEAGNQGRYNQAIAASPTDVITLAIGWQNGTYISNDGGKSFVIQSAGDELHHDVHGLYFDPGDPSGETLYICSDGGLAVTRDLGATFEFQLQPVPGNSSALQYHKPARLLWHDVGVPAAAGLWNPG